MCVVREDSSMNASTLALRAVLLFAAVACGGDADRAEESTGALRVVDGFTAPEDLELLPGGDLLIAEYGGITGARAGTIKVMRTDGSDAVTQLYPVAGAEDARGEGPAWGDPACESIGAAIAPHGVHLGQGPGGVRRLLVVNHGTRESIEFFEVGDADSHTPSLTWRGCVVAPDDVWLNDVAGLRDGGFVASNMTPRGTTVLSLLENSTDAGLHGYALEWNGDGGWRRIPGTEGLLINGITVSADEAVVYANHYVGNKVVAYERSGGKELWSSEVDGPDNPSWTPEGTLLIASHREDLKAVLECHERHEPYCGLAFGVVEIDPATGAVTELYTGEGAPFGGATAAVIHEGTLYLGSFTGERLGVVRLAQ